MKTPYYDVDNSLGFLTITTNRLMSACLRKRLVEAGIDITAEQWGVLTRLWNRNGIAQDELAYIVCVDKSSLSRVLDVMERRGLVCRMRDPDDARRKILFATDQADTLREPCLKAAREALATMLENVDSGELATCLKVLAQVKQNIRKQAE